MDQAYLEEGTQLALQFAKRGGLLPVVVQSVDNEVVLMLGYVNEDAVVESQRSGFATFWSTSRQQLWTKGASSGDRLALEEIRVDCDQDALLYRVRPLGEGACHTHNQAGQARSTCFYRKLGSGQNLAFLAEFL